MRSSYGFVASLLGALGLFCPMAGADLIVYSLNGYHTLSGTQAVGCFLVAVPFGIITIAIVELLRG